MEQECIPVGCILHTAVAITGGLHTPRAGTPWSRRHLEQAPPWSRHPSEQAPPGAGTPPPQLPSWVWAWKPARHAGIPPPWRPAARHAGIPPAMHAGIAPPVNRITDAVKI